MDGSKKSLSTPPGPCACTVTPIPVPWLGNQVSDVLREVNFDSTKEGQQYFEPKHRQYLQVRQQEYEVMEIALDDLNGIPVKLGPGVTSVVLHFRHRNGDEDV